MAISKFESEENKFAGFIYLLCSFGTSKEPSEATEGVKSFVMTHFARDYALFELACYMYFRIDMWLFCVRSDLREKIIRVFQREFVTLFSKALKMDNTADLFKQRVNKYGELARRDADPQEYHSSLSQLIYRTKDNQKPEL